MEKKLWNFMIQNLRRPCGEVPVTFTPEGHETSDLDQLGVVGRQGSAPIKKTGDEGWSGREWWIIKACLCLVAVDNSMIVKERWRTLWRMSGSVCMCIMFVIVVASVCECVFCFLFVYWYVYMYDFLFVYWCVCVCLRERERDVKL